MAETFTYVPSMSSVRHRAPRIKQTKFGNGYRQVYGDGINYNLETWDMVFTVNSDSDKTAIDNFFNTHGGYTYFDWTNPETGATQKQYTCPSWSITSLGAGNYTISAVFEEWAGLT